MENQILSFITIFYFVYLVKAQFVVVCWQHLRQNGIVRVSPVPPLLHVRCVCSPGNGVSDIGGTVRDELAWMLLTVARRVGALCWRGGGGTAFTGRKGKYCASGKFKFWGR